MLVSGTEYLDLDQIERHFCSTRQDYSQFQLEAVVEKRDSHPKFQQISFFFLSITEFISVFKTS